MNHLGYGHDGAVNDHPLIRAVIGKQIAAARLNKELDHLEFRFADGSGVYVTDKDAVCCSDRYMSCDDTLSDFEGAILLRLEVREGPSVKIDDHGNDEHDSQFLAVVTDRGEFTVSNHVEHNGYYSGFELKVGTLPEVAP